MGSRSTPWTAILTTLLFSGVGLAAIADTPRPSTQLSSGGGEALGMTAITMREATFNGPSDCAEIETPNTLIYLEHYATAEQRARLSVPEARDELSRLSGYAPDGSDLCTSPDARLLTAKGYPKARAVQGKQAYGLNLDGTTDGRSTANTCAHKKFEGLNGEAHVDNELYHVLGCQRYWRWEARTGETTIKDPFDFDQSSHGSKQLVVGEEVTLLEIRGVDDRRNDPEVEVLLASGSSAPIIGQDNRPVGWTTQKVGPDPRWRTQVRGRIENGVLHTDRFDFKLKRKINAAVGYYEMLGARMRLELTEEGGAKGVIAGYIPVDVVYWFRPATYGRGNATAGRRNCAGQYKALYDGADGYPDPETGQCTAISGAFAVEFVPAYVSRSQIAAAGAQAAASN